MAAALVLGFVLGVIGGAVVALLGVGVRENVHLAQLEAELGVEPQDALATLRSSVLPVSRPLARSCRSCS
jgi:hypothetical protein